MSSDSSDGLRVDGGVVARSALWSAFTTLVSFPALVVSTIVIARVLGPAGVGRIAFYTFVTTLVTGLGDLGVTNALMRRGMLAAGAGDTADLMQRVRAASSWSLVQIPVAILVGVAVLPHTDALVVYALGVIATGTLIGPSHMTVMTSRLSVASKVQMASTLLAVVSTIATAVATHRPDMTFAVGSLAAGALTGLKILGIPSGFRRASLGWGPIRLDRPDLVYGLSSVLNDKVATLVFSQSEVAFFRNSQQVARGRYAVAQTVAARSTLVLDALLGPLGPGMTSAFGRGAESLRRAFEVAGTTIVLLLVLACPLGFEIVALFAQPIFGHGFTGLGVPALVLTAASLFQSAAGPIVGLCWARRHVRPLLVSGLVGSAVDVAIAVLLVPRFGLVAAVVASVVAQAAYFVALILQIAGRSERQMAARHAAKLLVVLTAMLIPAIALMTTPRPAASALALPVAVGWTALMSRVWIRVSRPDLSGAIGMFPSPVRRLIRSRVVEILLGTGGLPESDRVGVKPEGGLGHDG